MWPEIARYLPKFDDAVLTGLDTAGHSFSVRCRPVPDPVSEMLRISIPDTVPLQSGPACLLFHKHDDNLWNLLSFVLRGSLECHGNTWIFVPEVFIPGVGIGGITSYLKFLIHGRRATNRYLRKRGLARPKIPWDEWQEVFDQANQ